MKGFFMAALMLGGICSGAEPESVSAPIFYNKGTALWGEKKPGEAVLWLRRALLLNPKFPEARQNLSFMRREIGFLDFGEPDWKPAVNLLSRNGWLILGFSAFWACVFLLLARGRHRNAARAGAALATLVFAVAALAWWMKRDAGGAKRLYIAAADKPLSVYAAATATSSESVAQLPPGSEVEAAQFRGPWIYARLPGEKRGWIRLDEVAPLWPWDENYVP